MSALSRSNPTSNLTLEYAVLPADASEIIKQNTIHVRDPRYIQPLVEYERQRSFHALVRRYMNQLLYGCQREICHTPSCYTARKRLPANTNASRRLTLLSARIMAYNLASQDDPLKQLCPGKPVVPIMDRGAGKGTGLGIRDSNFREEIPEVAVDDEKENRDVKQTPPPKDREGVVVMDKGLKDPRSFSQQLFSTAAMKLVDWIGLPPPANALGFLTSDSTPAKDPSTVQRQALPLPHEPPKFKIPSNAMEVMDMGQIHQDTEPVSQLRHQEILQQRKRTLSLKDVVTQASLTTPKSKSSSANAFMMPPPPPPHHNNPGQRRPSAQMTPTRGDKTTPILESPEAVVPPQSLKVLDEAICQALADLTSKDREERTTKEVANFVKQSFFYVFSNPEALLASFGGIGDGDTVEFDPDVLNRTLEIVYKAGWGDLVKRFIWKGLAPLFDRKTPPREAAALLIIGLHILANALEKDQDVFSTVTAVRAEGLVSIDQIVMPDIGFEDETAVRLMKRIVLAIATHGPESEVYRYLRDYMLRCHQKESLVAKAELEKELGPEMVTHTLRNLDQWGFNRCALEWTRAVFMLHWNGRGFVKKDSLTGACLRVFELLHSLDAIGEDIFPTNAVGERLDPTHSPMEWFNKTPKQSEANFHLIDFPYVLGLQPIVTFFRAINLDTMKNAFESTIAYNRLTAQMSSITNAHWDLRLTHPMGMTSMYFVLSVRRDHVVEDTFNQLIYRERRELMRPLRVQFVGGDELGHDQGGVQQEFFVLLLNELLNSDYGLFVSDSRTQMTWINQTSLEGLQKFNMVGVIIGLALYNGVTLPVSFPLAFYMKLLGQEPTLDDIGDMWPDLQQGLRELLTWEDGDVGDVFCRTYEYSYDCFGEVRSIDMSRAEENGIEHMEQPIPKERKNSKAPRGVSPTWDRPMSGIFNLSVNPSDWLPVVNENPGHDEWLGSLNDVLLSVANEDIAGGSSEEEAPPILLPGFRRHSEPNSRGYTISYHNLNDDTFSASSGDSEGSESAATVPLPADQPADFVTRRMETRAERAQRELEEHIRMLAAQRDRELARENASVTDGATETSSSADAPTLPDIDENPIIWEEPREVSSEVPTPATTAVDDTALPLQSLLTPTRSPSSKAKPEPVSNPSTRSHSPDQNHTPPPEAPLVTNANRHAFVQDYLAWLLNRSVYRQHTSLTQGIFTIINPRTLRPFTPAHLQNLLQGNSTISIRDLQDNTQYDGYTTTDRSIRDFWSIVHTYDEDMKRRLLEFVTSSPRVPVGGMEKITFVIVKQQGDSEMVPTSATCFGKLTLPEYKSRRKMREKLKIALENCVGFGIM